jgi:hypothetical protein
MSRSTTENLDKLARVGEFSPLGVFDHTERKRIIPVAIARGKTFTSREVKAENTAQGGKKWKKRHCGNLSLKTHPWGR